MNIEEDKEFTEEVIDSVLPGKDGWIITFENGWSMHVPSTSPVKPEKGMTAKLYGKGFGYSVRGMSFNGTTAFYKDEETFEAEQNEQFYGKDAQDWLDRWDAGKTVWSVEMGGLGPGYEQCIQIIAAESVRWALEKKPDFDSMSQQEKEELSKEYHAHICENSIIEKLGGVSGSQVSGGQNIAMQIYRRGPIAAFTDPYVKDRTIQVSKSFPNPYGA